jgi:hypothetical protein
MNSRSGCHRWGGFFLLLLLVAGCTFSQSLRKPDGETDFLHEISRLEKVSREHPLPSVRAQCHLQLAFLYVEARNPHLNYSRALEELRIYLSLSPDKVHTADVENWLAVLREIDHLRADKIELAERNRTLRASNEKAQEANKNLRDEAVKLKETIEKLNYLDRQLEEKRRLMK